MGDSFVHDRRTAADAVAWVRVLRQYIVRPGGGRQSTQLRCRSRGRAAPGARFALIAAFTGALRSAGGMSLADTIGRRQRSSAARVALVTGAAQGLGLATAMLLAHQGYELVLADVQNLDAVLGGLRAQGVE